MFRFFLNMLIVTTMFSTVTGMASEQKGNFALTFQGGAWWELGEDDFNDALPLINASLEYYLLDPVALGSQFSFSQSSVTSSVPIFFPAQICCYPPEQRTDQLYQTFFYLRFVETNRSPVKFFILGGPTINHVRRKSGGSIREADSDGIEPVDNPIGAKLGLGVFIHFSRHWALNLTTAMDTKPEIFSSATGGLSVFVGPVGKKAFGNGEE